LAHEVLRRLQHPTATFSQIEAALDERLGHLRARMLEEVAMASEVATFSQESATARPQCPSCGAALHCRGQSTRHLQTHAGQDVVPTRSYGTCPACGVGLFPLDEQLDLLPGSLTPRLQEHLVRLGSWLEFDPAATLLGALTGAQVTEATARRQTEEAGAVLAAWKEQEVARLECECPPAPAGLPNGSSPWTGPLCRCYTGSGRKCARWRSA
jgi:hypothetical protein